jgi:hypothetical protein
MGGPTCQPILEKKNQIKEDVLPRPYPHQCTPLSSERRRAPPPPPARQGISGEVVHATPCPALPEVACTHRGPARARPPWRSSWPSVAAALAEHAPTGAHPYRTPRCPYRSSELASAAPASARPRRPLPELACPAPSPKVGPAGARLRRPLAEHARTSPWQS